MTVYILGGGPSGLAVAHGLLKDEKQDFVLIEQQPTTGGLAQTLHWKGVGYHDLGPHKIFSLDEELIHTVRSLLPESDWLSIKKTSSIYLNGCYLNYPPSPFSLIRVFGFRAFVIIIYDYALAMFVSVFRDKHPSTFERDLVSRLGHKLYSLIFRPIAMKLWGDPKKLDAKLSAGRVQTPKIAEVLKQALGIRKSSEFEALFFDYPSGGLQRLWSSIERLTETNGTYMLAHSLQKIDVKNGCVERLVITCKESGEEKSIVVTENDFVVSTLPIKILTKCLNGGLSDRIEKIVNETILLNDLILVFLHVDKKKLLPVSWVFVPDEEIIFHRVSEQSSFDPGMVGDGTIVCCEVMSNKVRLNSDKSDAAIISEVCYGLEKMGYSGYEILKTKVIRLPQSYPVFLEGYEKNLEVLLNEFDSLKNFRTIGRQGSFNYIGTLDAMDIGYGFASWFCSEQGRAWVDERNRTKFYPVLD